MKIDGVTSSVYGICGLKTKQRLDKLCDYLSGHIFPLTSSRRMFPIFDQFQLEEMDVTPGREEVVQPETTYEPIDNLDELDSDWMDIP